MEILDLYRKYTEMQINLDKSSLSYNKNQEEQLFYLREEIPYPLKTLLKGFKYFGFELNPNAYTFHEWI